MDAPPGLWRLRDFKLYLASQLATNFAGQIVTVAIGWRLYDLTRDPLDLGLAGLVEFLPSLLLILVTSQVADRFDRRFVVVPCVLAETAFVLGGVAIAGLWAAWFPALRRVRRLDVPDGVADPGMGN